MQVMSMRSRQLFLLLPVFCLVGGVQGGSLPSREEVLETLFPGSTIRAERVFLTGEQRRQAAALSGGEVPSALIARYLAWEEGKEIGRAYVDTHVVRTKKESLLICLNEKGVMKRIEVTAFLEPHEYMVHRTDHGRTPPAHTPFRWRSTPGEADGAPPPSPAEAPTPVGRYAAQRSPTASESG